MTQYAVPQTEQLDSTELPESIGNLTSLTELDVRVNQLTSEFPRMFLETSTQYLTTEQLVSTELPESIGNLAKLETFSCDRNQLTSEFPRTFLAPPKPVRSIEKLNTRIWQSSRNRLGI